MFFLDAEVPKSHDNANGCFLLWDARTRRILGVNHATEQLPRLLVPDPVSSWPEQLDADTATTILAVFRANTPTELLIHIAHQNWYLAFTPTDADHWLIFAKADQIQPDSQHLAVLELEKKIQHLQGAERNQQILETLRYYTQCDRLSLWLVQPHQLQPLYWSESAPLPHPISLTNRRYIRALEVRHQLGISDTFHQPLLSHQSYHREHGILARLDTAVFTDKKICAVLMLEYRQLQQSFASDLFALSDSAARLLALQDDLQIADAEHAATQVATCAQFLNFHLALTTQHGTEFTRQLQNFLNSQFPHTSRIVITRYDPQYPRHFQPCPQQNHGSFSRSLKVSVTQQQSLRLAGPIYWQRTDPDRLFQNAEQTCTVCPILTAPDELQGAVFFFSTEPQILLDAEQHKVMDWLGHCLAQEFRDQQLQQQIQIAETALDNHSGLVVINQCGRIEKVNRAFSLMTGFTPSYILQKSYQTLRPRYLGDQFYHALLTALDSQDVWEGEDQLLRNDGFYFPINLRVVALKAHGHTHHYVCTFQSLAQQKRTEARIEKLAYLDELTGLPNRRAALEQLASLHVVDTARPAFHGLFLLDIDNFKTINDSLGHVYGDLLLIKISQRLQLHMADEYLAKVSADQYLILYQVLNTEETDARQQAEIIAQQLTALFLDPFELNGITLHITCSAGVTLFQKSAEPLELLKQVETASHIAKRQGLSPYAFFTRDMAEAIRKRLELNTQLRNALALNEFQLMYQPQYDTQTGRLIGAEALLRWHHQGMVISPADFIPVAEETSLINDIGWWVLKQACHQYMFWLHQRYTLPSISVNVSARQFHCHDFTDQVTWVLHESGMDPHYLVLEITESVVLENVEDTILKMQHLRKLGVSFSIDDFGTGYSSLSYLKTLPVNEIKLDRTFINQVADDKQALALVSCIVNLAKNFGFRILAEGVETEQQLSTLKTLRCDAFQGFLRSRPLSQYDFTQLLANPAYPFRLASI